MFLTPIEDLARLLADSAQFLEMGTHSYVVGGGPRDFLLGHDVKDLDVVVERRNGKDAVTLGSEIAIRLGLKGVHADGLGVVHLGPFPKGTLYPTVNNEGQKTTSPCVDLEGQKIEIVTARKEKYDRTRGSESHKPVSVTPGTIQEDLQRRDFTINTLVWRLQDLGRGFKTAPVFDLLEMAEDDLRQGILRTPLDPHETFDDDPSRMLRAIRFMAKYDFKIEDRTYQAITDRAHELQRLAYSAIDPLFFDKILMLEWDRVEKALAVMSHTGLLTLVKDMIPAARQRRALLERFPSFAKRLKLYWWGLKTDFQFVGTQRQRFQDFECFMSEAELNARYEKFQNPIDTRRFIELSGAQGPAIGAAVAKARDLVLLGLSDDRVMETLLKEHKAGTP